MVISIVLFNSVLSFFTELLCEDSVSQMLL